MWCLMTTERRKLSVAERKVSRGALLHRGKIIREHGGGWGSLASKYLDQFTLSPPERGKVVVDGSTEGFYGPLGRSRTSFATLALVTSNGAGPDDTRGPCRTHRSGGSPRH